MSQSAHPLGSVLLLQRKHGAALRLVPQLRRGAQAGYLRARRRKLGTSCHRPCIHRPAMLHAKVQGMTKILRIRPSGCPL